jgi:hypothetical protein
VDDEQLAIAREPIGSTASAEATAKLAELKEQRARAAVRVDDVEREARQAGAAVQQCLAELAEVERSGATARRRTEAEAALATARQAADQQLWAARLSGAQQGLRECDQAIRAHISANLCPLLAEQEAAGELAAQRVDAAAAELVAAWMERERIAAGIGELVSKVARVEPTDVSRSRAEAAAQAAILLANQGGEVAPALDRRRDPWALLLPQPAPEVVSA